MAENEQELASRRSEGKLYKWQAKVLPVMVKMLIGLTLFFFAATMVQLFYLHQRIQKAPEFDLKGVTNPAALASLPETSKLDALRWTTLSQLESYCVQRRYHQANVLLMSRAWFGYLGFVTGMICTFIGAAFILGKLQEPVTQVAAEASAWKLSIISASPGMMLSLLGTVLMITTMLSPARIDVRDGPSFINSWTANSGYVPPPEQVVDSLNLTTHTNK